MSEMITCEKCGAENAINDIDCRNCHWMLPRNRSRLLEENETATDPLNTGNSTMPEKDVHLPARSDDGRGSKRVDNPLLGEMPSDSHLSSEHPNGLKNLGKKPVKVHKKLWLISVAIIVIIASAAGIFLLAHQSPSQSNSNTRPTSVPSVPLGILSNGIGVTFVKGEYIGISDGSYALDTNRPGGSLKMDASASLRARNIGVATTQWANVLDIDSNDAESQIYEQDQSVLASANPYITIVVGVQLSSNDPYSHDVLQGAYVAQEEINGAQRGTNGVMIRLLIAKSGSDPARSGDVARQIVKAAQADKTIVGVLGWPTTSTTQNALAILAQAHIPIVSASAAGKILASPYFFRVTATSDDQVRLLSDYVKNRLNPQNLVIFIDSREPYSYGLAKSFEKNYQDSTHTIAYEQNFQTDEKPADLSRSVQDVLKRYKPNVVLFTSISVNDAIVFLGSIQNNQQLTVVMGGTGYTLAEAEANHKYAGYTRIRFAATAFPDAWQALGKKNPLFITEYQKAFDPQNKHQGAYTYSRPTSYAMLGYDAILAFQKASQVSFKGKPPFTPSGMRQGLTQINGVLALQGITGMISFDASGNATNKAVFILRVDNDAHLKADAYQGCYFINAQCTDSIAYLD